jgi:hypothetical protein
MALIVKAEPKSQGPSMSRFFRSVIIALSVSVVAASASFAQTPKHLSPGEMAAADRAKAEKTAACRAQAKEQKLTLLKRHAFVKDCVAKP